MCIPNGEVVYLPTGEECVSTNRGTTVYTKRGDVYVPTGELLCIPNEEMCIYQPGNYCIYQTGKDVYT